jgi:prepilin-type N-terminal cleavage/methylation domain-containing protein/prepilin-type processing-associated H-X9-DG protein
MVSRKMTSKAFTLIELLVVIAIIALLLSIIMPALKRVKEAGKQTVCLAHLHSLGISWLLYADENDGVICNAKTARITEVSSNPRELVMNWAPGAYHNEPTWVGWFDEPIVGGEFVVDEVARQACVTMGSLFPYNEALDIYICPAGKERESRMFAITDAMNGHDLFEPVGKVIRKKTRLRSPGTRLVFLDEGWATTESWTIYPDQIQWWDPVPLRHGEGTTVGMADGSSEYWKWRNQKTIDFANGLRDSISSAQDNEDFLKIQRAAWGRVAQ